MLIQEIEKLGAMLTDVRDEVQGIPQHV